MSIRSKNTMLVVGALVAIASLPLGWFQVPVSTVLEELQTSVFQTELVTANETKRNVQISGLSTTFSWIYLIVFAVATSNILGLMYNTGHFVVPRILARLVPLSALALLVFFVINFIVSYEATMNVGVILALIGACLPIIAVAKSCSYCKGRVEKSMEKCPHCNAGLSN